ncbi:MAG: c-type cytochrome domain-containing protein, partial [Planctomycetota bacterium]
MSAASLTAQDAVPRYNREIRPLLAEHCFACHGPDAAQRQADLRLDDRAAALAAGALDPDDWSASELLARIESSDPELMMPPPEAQKPLQANDRQTIRRWVLAGAAYEQHWAYVPPVRPNLPAVVENQSQHPIDRLIDQSLAKQGLSPAPLA